MLFAPLTGMAITHEIIGYPLFLVAGLELLLGFSLIKQNPQNSPVNKTAAALAFFSSAFALCTGIMYIRASLGLDYNVFARANWIGWFSVPAALQFIHYLKDERSRSARLIGSTLYPFWSVVLGLSLFTDLIVTHEYVLLPYVNEPGPLEKPLRLFGAFLIVWTLYKINVFRRRSTGQMRKDWNLFFFGLLIFGGGTGLASALLPLAGGFGLEPGLGSYFGLPWVLLTFYAIARYRLFDIRIIASRFVATVLLALIFSAVQTALFLLLSPSLGPALSIFISLPLIGFIFFGTPLTRRLQAWINSVIVRDRYDYQDALRESTAALATILHFDDLQNYILESVRRSFGVQDACLYMVEPDGSCTLRRGIGRHRPDAGLRSLAELALAWIAETRRTVIRVLVESLLPDEKAAALLTYLRGIGAELLVPLYFQGRLLGVLSVGPKSRHAPYTQSDIVLLETLAGQAAIAIENMRLLEETFRAKESLLESEAKFRTLAQTIPAGIFILKGGRFLYVNPAGSRLFGYREDELLNREFQQVVHPDYRDIAGRYASGTPGSHEPATPDELKIVKKNGEERWVILSAGTTEYQGRPSVIGTLFDVTERKNLEGKLFYMQKMETIGKLASGIAHDFNNILSGIVGHGSMLQEELRRDDPQQYRVEQILASTERAAALTQRLLSFGARRETSLQPCDLQRLVIQQEKFLLGVLREGIRLRIEPPETALMVLADAGQIERIILNLVVNARDAMPRGGDIVVAAGTAMIDEEFVRTQGFGKLGRYAFFSVKDTGLGMDASVSRRVFEPFFTTKGSGKSAGFGLSIVYDIVKEHKGYITAASEPGKGALFTVYLPLVSAAPSRAVPDTARQACPGTETVLVAEDEKAVRKHFRTVLEECGYRVIEAEDGWEALATYRSHKDDIELVIADIIMPRMNGRELYHGVKEIRPEAKVLFTSGYDEDLLIQTGILEPGHPFLLKPASRQEILSKIREALDRGRDGRS
jgi:PAS domain S-box-containing protein